MSHDNNVEELLALMKDETIRGIQEARSYAARVAWYWTHIGAIEMARQLDLITEERRQELEQDFRAFKPEKEGMERMNEDLRGPSGNKLPTDYVNSIEGRMLIVLDDLEKAIWILAQAGTDPAHHTKANILDRIRVASDRLLRIRREFKGH